MWGPRYDDDSNFDHLIRQPLTVSGTPGALPRRSSYGTLEAEGCGLMPLLDFPDMLPDVKDFKAVIQECHAKQIFPLYHRKASSLPQSPSQDGLGHCWNYGLTAAVEDTRLVENHPAAETKLAPNSLAWLVDWQNEGYYLDATIKGAGERGIATAEYCPEYELNPKRFKKGWEGNALLCRPKEWWDTRRKSGDVAMIQQCLAILRTGRPGYIAYDWWGHALATVGMDWDESVPNGIVWIDFNSHGDGLIELTGSRGIPDEFYGVRATTAP